MAVRAEAVRARRRATHGSKNSRTRERGFALVVVLLVLALVAVAGGEFAYSMRLEAAAVRAYKAGIIGNHLAEAALAQAVREIVSDAAYAVEETDGLLTFCTAARVPLARLKREKVELTRGRVSERSTTQESRPDSRPHGHV